MYLDGIWLKRSWGGEVKNVAVLVAIGVREDGYPLTRASSWMRTLTDTTPGQGAYDGRMGGRGGEAPGWRQFRESPRFS